PLTAVVGRAVVDDDHLEVPVRLGEDALERGREGPTAVVDGDDDPDERRASMRRPAAAPAGVVPVVSQLDRSCPVPVPGANASPTQRGRNQRSAGYRRPSDGP